MCADVLDGLGIAGSLCKLKPDICYYLEKTENVTQMEVLKKKKPDSGIGLNFLRACTTIPRVARTKLRCATCHLIFLWGVTQLLSGNAPRGRLLPRLASHPTAPQDGCSLIFSDPRSCEEPADEELRASGLFF